MPNRAQHETEGRAVGALVGSLGNLVVQERRMRERPGTPFSVAELAVTAGYGILLGEVGATMPDETEPATWPGHRRGAHSWATLWAVTLGTIAGAASDLPGPLRLAVGAVGASYVVHLVSDAATPRGLPLL